MAMNTLSESFEEQLEKACQELSLKPTKQQQERLLEYLRQLLKWNKTYNLTAIRDPELALVQHVFDSLAIIKPLNNFIHLNVHGKRRHQKHYCPRICGNVVPANYDDRL